MPCQHPGKILLKQYLEPQKISQNRLARAIKVPPRRINEIIHEKRAVSTDTAVRLALYFGNSASYWMHLQAAFDIAKISGSISRQLNMMQPAVAKAVSREGLDHETNQMSTQKPAETRIRPPSPGNSLKKRIMR